MEEGVTVGFLSLRRLRPLSFPVEVDMYEEHFEEHPEEYEGIKALKTQTRLYEIERQKRREEKLKLIEACREELRKREEENGDNK